MYMICLFRAWNSNVCGCHRLSCSKNRSVCHETASEGISSGEDWLSVLHFAEVHARWWRWLVQDLNGGGPRSCRRLVKRLLQSVFQICGGVKADWAVERAWIFCWVVATSCGCPRRNCWSRRDCRTALVRFESGSVLAREGLNDVAEGARNRGEVVAAGKWRLYFRRTLRDLPVRPELPFFCCADKQARHVISSNGHVHCDWENFLAFFQRQGMRLGLGEVWWAAISDGGAVQVAKWWLDSWFTKWGVKYLLVTRDFRESLLWYVKSPNGAVTARWELFPKLKK